MCCCPSAVHLVGQVACRAHSCCCLSSPGERLAALERRRDRLQEELQAVQQQIAETETPQ